MLLDSLGERKCPSYCRKNNICAIFEENQPKFENSTTRDKQGVPRKDLRFLSQL